MRNTIDILGVPVDNVTMDMAVERVHMFIEEQKVHTVYTPNAEIMMVAQRDKELKSILCKADLLVADGAGVVLASRILKTNLPERVAGFDLVKKLFYVSKASGISFFLFGGKPGVAEEAGKNILTECPWVKITGYRNGYFSREEEDCIINQINNSGADILLVAHGAPRQEKWIDNNKNKLKVKVCIGVGGSLDVFAGKVKRAPKFFQRHNLEWLYRLYKEPWRFKRMLDLPRFVLKAYSMRLKHRR